MERCNDGNDVAMALDTALRQPFKVSAQENQSGTTHSVAPDARRWVPEGRWMPRRCPATKSMPSGVLVLYVLSERMESTRTGSGRMAPAGVGCTLHRRVGSHD